MNRSMRFVALFAHLALFGAACFSSAPEGLAPAEPAATTVKFDFFHKPLPEIPLPNDIATRYDETSATGRRVNASVVAPSKLEQRVRRLIDSLDGWGTLQPIAIPFTGPLNVQSILDGHRDSDYALDNDVIYLVNVDPDSPKLGTFIHLDLGNGNYPVLLEKMDNYWRADPRAGTISLGFEEVNEDLDGDGKLGLGEDVNGDGIMQPNEDVNLNGILDPPEDTDADGILDEPNYLPGTDTDVVNWQSTDLAARADALMTFFEKQTNTLLVRPMISLDERTTYAVVITKRLEDEAGDPVGSPFDFINHASQTEALAPLRDILPENGLALDDIAFAFTFTTQTVQSSMQAVRDGLYGHGVQDHLGNDYPARLESLEILHDQPDSVQMPFILRGERWVDALETILIEIEGKNATSDSVKAYLEGARYIDYIVIGSFISPQLFPRSANPRKHDVPGAWLPFDEQSWPQDLDRVAAPARPERVYFTLTVPRAIPGTPRGDGQPVPVVLQGHGYGSNRLEGMQTAGFFAKHGFATIGIDGPSHGVSLGDFERIGAEIEFAKLDLLALADAMLKDRAHNQDNDVWSYNDSGSDFWTAYLFHTRDVVRQFTLDFFQLVRILRSFDGQRHWHLDMDGDGQQELAGDFDADGTVDIGKDSMLAMVGGSLGGIMSMMVGSLEPELTAITPIAGGGGFADMGVRTVQGGAIEGFILRAMGPLIAGTLDMTSNELSLEMIFPAVFAGLSRSYPEDAIDGGQVGSPLIATVGRVYPWDTMVVENMANGERGCGYINDRGEVRASIASDVGDPLRVLIYRGPALAGDTECGIREGKYPQVIVDTFGHDVEWGWDEFGVPYRWRAGEPLVALADGLGLPRNHPDLRRFQGLGQLVLDPADPASFARHLSKEPLYYEGTQTSTGTHAIIITTLGDLSVPASSGITYGRCAGFIDYTNADGPGSGPGPISGVDVPANQRLLEAYVGEAVHTTKRYIDPASCASLDPADPACGGAHLDVENFSEGTDRWGVDYPRLDSPMRIGLDPAVPDPLNGVSASLFPLPEPTGAHGFDLPGGQLDHVRGPCRNACTDDNTVCLDNCRDTISTFDIGYFMFNYLAFYLKSGGTEVPDPADWPALSVDDWPGRIPAPLPRDLTGLE